MNRKDEKIERKEESKRNKTEEAYFFCVSKTSNQWEGEKREHEIETRTRDIRSLVDETFETCSLFRRMFSSEPTLKKSKKKCLFVSS
jgi:hypothetical protein